MRAKLAEREAARPAVFGLDPIGRDVQRLAAAVEKVSDRVAFALPEIVPDDERGRVAGLRRAVGPAYDEPHFRHWRPPAGVGIAARAPPRRRASRNAPRPQARARAKLERASSQSAIAIASAIVWTL